MSEFTVSAGDTVPFVLTYGALLSRTSSPNRSDGGASRHGGILERDGQVSLKEPMNGRSRSLRSLITLKALTYRPTGGIVAAPTTSPARSARRPAQLGLPVLLAARCDLHALCADEQRLLRGGKGLARVVGSRRRGRPVAGSDHVRTCAGERRLTEWEVPWLGYEGAKPVRIGNAASEQMQLDIYGEVMDALHQARATETRRRRSGLDLQQELLKHLETIWGKPDQGIWEVRGGPRQFTYSKVMAWVALTAA